MSRPAAPPSPALRLVFVACLAAFAALAAPAGAQPAPLPGVGEVGQGIEWSGFLAPTPLAAGEAIVFVAEGVVGAQPRRELGRLAVAGGAGGVVVTADFRALGDAGMRIALLDGATVVHEVPQAEDVEVIVPDDPIETPLAPGVVAAGADTVVPALVTVDLATFPGGSGGSVTFSLGHGAGPGGDSGAVVPAPAFTLDLGTRAAVTVGGETHQATAVAFLSRQRFPPLAAPSAILERVEVFTTVPGLAFAGEVSDPGVLFFGVPVTPGSGPLGVRFDAGRDAIAEIDLGLGSLGGFLRTGEAAGAAVTWEPADLAAGAVGSGPELTALGPGLGGGEFLGTLVVSRTPSGWSLALAASGGLGGEPLAVQVDGQTVVEVTVPTVPAVFGRAAAPPSGAAVFPAGLGGGAFYRFSWDQPVAIEVPGVGTFTGSALTLRMTQPVGTMASAAVTLSGLAELTLTGVAAPDASGGPCISTATRLCLAGGRYAVDVAWADPFGGSGPGVAGQLTADTGTFWFFDEDNLELMVKVLVACPVNGHVWVFAGGLTNVEVELVVTDTRTEMERVYRNAQGVPFQPLQDTAAFVCTP